MPRKLPRIYDLPYTDLVAELPPGAAPLPLADGAGSAFVERDIEEPEEAVAGRIALLVGGDGLLQRLGWWRHHATDVFSAGFEVP